MNMAEMTQQDKHDLEKFRDTERRRERERQIKAQAALGPVKTWQQREIEAEDLFESLWKRGMAPKTY
jgi:hypothetical protein